MIDFNKFLHTKKEWEEMESLLSQAEKYGFNPPIDGTDDEKWAYYEKSIAFDPDTMMAIQEDMEEAQATGN